MSKYEKIFAFITVLFAAFTVMRVMTSATLGEGIGFFILLAVLPWVIYLIFRKK